MNFVLIRLITKEIYLLT